MWLHTSPRLEGKNSLNLYLMLGINAFTDEDMEELTQLYMYNGQNIPVLKSCPGTPKHHEAGQLPSLRRSHICMNESCVASVRLPESDVLHIA